MASADLIETESETGRRPVGPAGAVVWTAVSVGDAEQYFKIDRLSWDAYTTMNDALVERSSPRMIFCSGRLILMSRSSIHEWLVRWFEHFVIGLAVGLDLDCEPSGETTYRNEERGAGLEGDTTFYFGDGAARIRRIRSIDLRNPPPPELAIEVEVSHPADQAARAWALLGVPELWRFDVHARRCSFWRLGDKGVYEEVPTSRLIPQLSEADVRQQLALAEEIGVTRWAARLPAWSRDELVPRQAINHE